MKAIDKLEAETRMALAVAGCIDALCRSVPGDYTDAMRATLDEKIEKAVRGLREEIIDPFLRFSASFLAAPWPPDAPAPAEPSVAKDSPALKGLADTFARARGFDEASDD